MKNVNKYNKEILIGETRRQVWLVGVMIVTHTHTSTHIYIYGYFSHSLCNVIATIFQWIVQQCPTQSTTTNKQHNRLQFYKLPIW